MAYTMADAAAHGGYADFDRALYKRFTELSPVLSLLPWRQIQGNTDTYTVEDSLPTAAWRGVNGTTTSTNGTVNRITEELKILYVQGQMDRFLRITQGNQMGAVDIRATMYDQMAQAMSNAFDQAFWEGDETTDINTIMGMRQRITGSQVVSVTTNGGPLTLDLLDQVIDLVPFPNRHIFCNRFIRRKINTLVRSAGTSLNIMMDPNGVGRQIESYGDVPIHIVERTGDASSILGFDETSGSSATTASLYVVAFGDDLTSGIYAGDAPAGLNVTDLGELQTQPQELARMEFYAGLELKHSRCAARLRSLTAA